jgi:hypothetical protein
MADRWFLVPLVGDGTPDNLYRPKYGDDVDSYSGQRIPESWLLNILKGDHYAVRFYASTTTLDKIEDYKDAHTIQENPAISEADVASYLNQKTGKSRSFSSWLDYFQA